MNIAKNLPILSTNLNKIVATGHIYSVVMELHRHNGYTFCQQKSVPMSCPRSNSSLGYWFSLFGHRCKDMAMLPILSILFHYPWLTITSKQTALGCSCKQNIGMSRRNYQTHDPAPLSLYHRTTTESRYISDHKNCGQEKPG
jgi:hypothetical protein